MSQEIELQPPDDQISAALEEKPPLFELFYSSGVFDERNGDKEAAIDEVVSSLQPEDRLSVAAAIRKIARQHSEDAIRRVESRMQLAQEVGRIGCFEIDMRDGTSVGTPAFFELYGLPPDQGSWSQHEWLASVHPDDRDNVVTHLKQLAAGTELTRLEYRVVRTDGEVRWTASRAALRLDPTAVRSKPMAFSRTSPSASLRNLRWLKVKSTTVTS